VVPTGDPDVVLAPLLRAGHRFGCAFAVAIAGLLGDAARLDDNLHITRARLRSEALTSWTTTGSGETTSLRAESSMQTIGACLFIGGAPDAHGFARNGIELLAPLLLALFAAQPAISSVATRRASNRGTIRTSDMGTPPLLSLCT
jgi:hypothetical protein